MRKSLAKPRTGTVAILDIGSTKICCLIARIGENGTRADHNGEQAPTLPGIRVIGIGHQVARGIRSGMIVDMAEAEECVRAAVHAAEKMADETIQRVFVNLSGGYPHSQTVGVEVSIGGQEVGDSDVRRILGQWQKVEVEADRQLIHSIPVGFSIDGSRGIRDPRGMCGDRLGANMHLVTAASSAVRNITSVVERCHLGIEAFVVSPYAAGLSCLVEDERDLGVTVIDMGGGTTTMAVFFDGSVIYTDCVPVGGAHITSDIARGLATPVHEAERLKTLYGSAIPSSLDEREVIDVPLVGEQDENHPNHVPKSLLIRIIHPRLEETFELVRNRLEASGFDKVAGRRVVITGGASQMPGIRDLAQEILDKQVRLGRPIRVNGLADVASGPAFATSAGLLAYAADPALDASRQGHVANKETGGGLFGRVGSWLRENF
ncbi:cell division protein FtsA [Nisaea sp.]|uniref:cell division protein FtsA n=1 Tax=Nisaea sp. TaxID=2024842 RepID=UPI003263F2CF